MNPPTLDELNLLHNRVCRAVGDVKRLEIFYALHEQPRNVTALAEALSTPQPTISRHLAMLRQHGLVIAEREGSSVVYRLADARIIQVLDTMRAMLREMVEQSQQAIQYADVPE